MNSFLEIDINAIKYNLEKLSKNKKMCIMLKANCYGCGFGVVKHFLDMGYNFFGVSTYEEALKIKEISSDTEVLIVAKIPKTKIKNAIERNIILTVVDFDDLDAYKKARIHIKIDAGMNRLGFKKFELTRLKEVVRIIKPEGIFSHLPHAMNEKITLNHIEYFKNVLADLDYRFEWIHLENSTALIKYNLDFTNMARPGIAVLGYFSNYQEKCELNFDLRESMKLMAFVEQKKYSDGYVGYDSLQYYKGELLTLRIGYYDGISRSLKGYEFNDDNKIIGNICMCQMMVSCHDFVEDFFEIFGEKSSVYRLAEYQDKIVYEVLVAISDRIIRIYKK